MSVQNDATTISAAELRGRLDDPGLTIVDVRPLPAYNGWRLNGEARGGHIPGAVAFPSAWLSSVDAAEVERLLHSKDIVPGRDVVLYGDNDEDVSAVRTRLTELGHAGVRTYEHGWAEWAADETLPVERLPNYDKLVHTEWLRQVLAGERPEAAPAGPFLLFHVNFGVPRSTRKVTSPRRCISTPTGSRVQTTGTAEHRRSSSRPCARSESPVTPRSSSTAAIPKVMPTRSGRDVEPGKSQPAARR